MNSKKKLIVALSTLCCVLVAAVVTVVVVLAATTQTLTSNIKVTYQATEIAGTAAASYKTEGNQTGTLHSTVTFTGADEDKKDVNVEPTITLTSSDRWVKFTYEFHNDGDKAFTAEVTYTDDATASGATASDLVDKNYVMYMTTTELSEEGSDLANVYAQIKANAASSESNVSVPENTADGETVKFYIYVAIDDVAKDAEFSGAFNWTLE